MITTDNPRIVSRKGYDRFPRFAITDQRTRRPFRFEPGDIVRGSLLDAEEQRVAGVASDGNPPTAAIANYDGGILEVYLTRDVVAAIATPANVRWLEVYLLREGRVHPLGVAPLALGPDITI